MELFSLLGNSQQLDGGAMFGNAPKALWSRWIKPDAENRIPLACRCLLVKGLLADGVGEVPFPGAAAPAGGAPEGAAGFGGS